MDTGYDLSAYRNGGHPTVSHIRLTHKPGNCPVLERSKDTTTHKRVFLCYSRKTSSQRQATGFGLHSHHHHQTC